MDRWAQLRTASHMLRSRISCFVSAVMLKTGGLYRVDRLPWAQGVTGSNPVAPTNSFSCQFSVHSSSCQHRADVLPLKTSVWQKWRSAMAFLPTRKAGPGDIARFAHSQSEGQLGCRDAVPTIHAQSCSSRALNGFHRIACPSCIAHATGLRWHDLAGVSKFIAAVIQPTSFELGADYVPCDVAFNGGQQHSPPGADHG
jgi:hypothetical protein